MLSRSRLASSVPLGSRFGGAPNTSRPEKSTNWLVGDWADSRVRRTNRTLCAAAGTIVRRSRSAAVNMPWTAVPFEVIESTWPALIWSRKKGV